MIFKYNKWIKITLFNFIIVAILGCLMRYKICFDFPILEQKNILHAHSHFAFSGWITQLLMILFLDRLASFTPIKKINYFNTIIYLNNFSSWGMLVFFSLFGYKHFSIFFSTISIFTAFIYSYFYFKELQTNLINQQLFNWFKASLFFLNISSLGPLCLGVMLATGNNNYYFYHSFIYFYLHFQYNGWFIFGIISIFLSQNISYLQFIKSEFKQLFYCTILTFSLSLLWIEIPQWLYSIFLFFGIYQLFIVIKIYYKIYPQFKTLSIRFKKLVSIISIVLLFKFLLQTLSGLPQLNQFIFGNRALIIAYLHLILLFMISIYLIIYLFQKHYFVWNRNSALAFNTFLISICINQMLLVFQGVGNIFYFYYSYVNQLLLYNSYFIILSLIWFYIQLKTPHKGV